MANDISGSVTGKIAFRIDKKSWDNLALFQKKMTSVKRQMSGLKGSIKVNAVVNSINKVTKATSSGYRKVDTEAAASAKRRYDIQNKWDNRRLERAKREKHIQYRTSGMEHSFRQRLGSGSAFTQALASGNQSIAPAIASYRRGTMTMKEFNQAVTQNTQSLIRNGVVAKQNATTFRSLRTDLVQATAAYTAFSLGANIFTTGKTFDSLKASMKLFAGDEAGVADTMKFLSDESERLGTNLQASAENFTKFAIVSRNKMSQAQTREFFSGFSEYATVLQVDQHRFARGMMAVQQMMSKGKISSEELNY
jgi:hypothetical protein